MDDTHPTLDLPIVVNDDAGSETFMAAYRWANKNGQRPFAGGSFSNGSQVAPFYLNCNDSFANANRNYASRHLIFDPEQFG